MIADFSATPLSSTPAGRYLCLDVIGDDAATARLKRLGICEGQPIRIVQSGDPMIVSVAGARVGLSRKLAERVLVTAEIGEAPSLAKVGCSA